MQTQRQQEPKRNYIGIVAEAADESPDQSAEASSLGKALDHFVAWMRELLTGTKKST